MSRRPVSVSAIFLLLLGVVGGCAPTCKEMCRKLLNQCDLDTQRVSFDECVTNCTNQQNLYDTWQNEELQSQFDDERRCIGKSSCGEIAAGACYEDFKDLYPFDPDKQLTPGTATPGS